MHTRTYLHPQITRETTLYHEITGASETLLSFRNIGSSPSPAICGVSVLDTLIQTGHKPTLHSFNGSSNSVFDYSAGHYRLDKQAASLPWPPGDNMHGPGGKDTVADGFRLWTHQAHSLTNQSESSCIQLCIRDEGCAGITFVKSGNGACYLIHPPILQVTREAGYGSWTKNPQQVDPVPPLQPSGGRVSDPVLPYFAVAGNDRALIASVAWSGWWRADVGWDANKSTASVTLGHSRERLCTTLHPGERIRTLGVAVVQVLSSELPTHEADSAETALDPAAGVARAGFNRHRQLLLRHKLPRDSSDHAIKGSIIASWSWLNWPDSSRPDQITQLWHVDAVKNTSVEYYWLDAGYFVGGFPKGVGNWQLPLENVINTTLFPNRSIAVLGERAHSSPNPVGFITWFEPERVVAGTYIDRTFPEYLLKAGGPDSDRILNLGNPDANAFIHDYLAAAVTAYDLDVLRIDYNIIPGEHWQQADGPSRTGITENRYIRGLYSLWDRLLAGRPGLMIDDCSSGGRRIDVETLSRSFPLWRSDHSGQGEPEYLQSTTVGLTQFAPVSSGAVFGTDPFLWRSAGVVGKTISWGDSYWHEVISTAQNITRLRQAVAETKGLRPVALKGNFYPLTAVYGLTTEWAAYQFNVPGEGGEGFAFYFRNEDCVEQSSMPTRLQALVPDAIYAVTKSTDYLPDGPAIRISGTELAVMPITLGVAGSMLLKYARVG